MGGYTSVLERRKINKKQSKLRNRNIVRNILKKCRNQTYMAHNIVRMVQLCISKDDKRLTKKCVCDASSRNEP